MKIGWLGFLVVAVVASNGGPGWGEIASALNKGDDEAAKFAKSNWTSRDRSTFLQSLGRAGTERLIYTIAGKEDFEHFLEHSFIYSVSAAVSDITSEEWELMDPDSCAAWSYCYIHCNDTLNIPKRCLESFFNDLGSRENLPILAIERFRMEWVSMCSPILAARILDVVEKKLPEISSLLRLQATPGVRYDISHLPKTKKALCTVTPDFFKRYQNADTLDFSDRLVHLPGHVFEQYSGNLHKNVIRRLSSVQVNYFGRSTGEDNRFLNLDVHHIKKGIRALSLEDFELMVSSGKRLGTLLERACQFIITRSANLQPVDVIRHIHPDDLGFVPEYIWQRVIDQKEWEIFERFEDKHIHRIPSFQIRIAPELFLELFQAHPTLAGQLLLKAQGISTMVLASLSSSQIDELCGRWNHQVVCGHDLLLRKSWDLVNFSAFAETKDAIVSQMISDFEKLSLSEPPLTVNHPGGIAWTTTVENSLVKSYGLITVPLSYQDQNNSDSTLELGVYRFKHASTTPTPTPKTHVIILHGGPGGWIDDQMEFAKTLIKESTPREFVTYLVDHRGTNHLLVDDWKSVLMELETLTGNPSLPIKDLTFQSAAMDVAMLVSALKQDGDWRAGVSKIMLVGISYGAALAYHTIQLFPTLLDKSVFIGMPPLHGKTRDFNIDGLLIACEMNPECRKKMGSNLVKKFRRMIRKITTDPVDWNPCTRLFYSTIYDKNILDNFHSMSPIEILSTTLSDIILSDVTAPLIMPFIKSLHDCPNDDIDQFKRSVLNPLISWLESDSNPSESHNKLVHEVIEFDRRHQDFASGKPAPKVSNLHPWLHNRRYETSWAALREYLAGRQPSKPGIIKSKTRTKLFFVSGLLDTRTPFQAGWKLYRKSLARHKHWLLVNNAGHQLSQLENVKTFVRHAIYGGNPQKWPQMFRDPIVKGVDFRYSGSLLSSFWDATGPDFDKSKGVEYELPPYMILDGKVIETD